MLVVCANPHGAILIDGNSKSTSTNGVTSDVGSMHLSQIASNADYESLSCSGTIINATSVAYIPVQNTDGGIDRATGLNLPTPAQQEWMKQNVPVVTDVRINTFALDRINQERATIGAPPLTAAQIGAVPVGDELVYGSNGSGLLTKPSATAGFPNNVDNSLSAAFPPIGNQGALGSCGAWATTYYALTYETNFALGRIASNGNTTNIFSPKWTYNMINNGADAGSSFYGCFNLLNQNGAATWAQFPYDSNYLQWCLNTTVWRDALDYRASGWSWIWNSNTLTEIQQMKTLLADGHVLVIGTYVYSWMNVIGRVSNDPSTTADDSYVGQYIATYCQNTASGYHAMTIVGYNDNIWCDLNHNGIVDPGEKGAFKVANSWGSYWNSGFVWVSYDALFSTSQVTSANGWPTTDRDPSGIFHEIYTLQVNANCQPTMVAEFTINTPLRGQLAMTLGVGGTATTSPTTFWHPGALYLQGGNYAFSGTTTPCDGTFVFDFSDLAPSSAMNQQWFLGAYDSTLGGVTTLKSYELYRVTLSGDILVGNATNVPVTIDNGQIYDGINYTDGGLLIGGMDPNGNKILEPISSLNISAGSLNLTSVDSAPTPNLWFSLVFDENANLSGSTFSLYMSKDGNPSLSSGDILYASGFNVTDLSQPFNVSTNITEINSNLKNGIGTFWLGSMTFEDTSIGMYKNVTMKVLAGPIPFSISNNYKYVKVLDGSNCFVSNAQIINIPQKTILIDGNSEFTAANGVVSGSGTSSNPYIIENWAINSSQANGIDVENTNAYFVIGNCTSSGNGTYDGILFSNVTNGMVEGTSVYDNVCGVSILNSSCNNTLFNNNCNNNTIGISLDLPYDPYGSYPNISNNNILTGNNCSNDGYEGIFLASNNNTLTNNICTNSGAGIYLYFASNNTLTNNNCSNDSNVGFGLWYSPDNTIVNNTCSSNGGDGISLITSIHFLSYSDCNTFINNTISNNGNAGVYFFRTPSNTFINNTISNNGGNGIDMGANSDYNTFINNTISNNGNTGIYLDVCWSNTIENDEIYNNSYGVYVSDYSSYNTLINNTISNSKDVGIWIGASDYTTIESNEIHNNSYGVYVAASTGTEIQYCEIYGNGNYGIYNNNTDVPYAVNATYCWWGSSTGPSGVGPGSGDAVSSNVIYAPWLTQFYVVPGISLTVTANATTVENNSAVTFTYNTTNTGDIPLRVSLSNAFGTMFSNLTIAPGQSNITMVIETLTTTIIDNATATGIDALGTTVSAKYSNTVTVIHPGILLTETANATLVPVNSPVVFGYNVTNTGDAKISNITIFDQTFNAMISFTTMLTPGQSTIAMMTRTISTNTTSVANASGFDQLGTKLLAFGKVTVNVSQPLYVVNFTETGLPLGTSWNVTFNNVTKASTASSITFNSIQSGNFSWKIASPISGAAGVRYVASVGSGSMYVPSKTSQSVAFTAQYYINVTSAHGTPTNGSAWVNAGSNFTTSVVSPLSGGMGIQYMCTGYRIDGGALAPGTACTFTSVKAAHSLEFDWVTQYYLNMTTNFGTVSPVSGWYNATTHLTISATSPPNASGERYVWKGWTSTGSGSYNGTANPATGAITMNGPIKEIASWYHQYLLNLSYAVLGGGVGYGAPTLSITTGGVLHKANLTGSSLGYWADVGSSWSVTNPLLGSNSTARWYTNQSASGTVSKSIAVKSTYYHQFLMGLSYSVVGGGFPGAPTFYASRFGMIVGQLLNKTATAYWFDYNSSWNVTNPLPGSNSSVRWYTHQSTSGTLSKTVAINFTYYYQLPMNLSYSVVGGGSPGAPTFKAYQFGSSVGQLLTKTATAYWFDNGSSWTVTNPLSGSNSSVRWYTSQTTGSKVSSPQTIAFVYNLQYYVNVTTQYGTSTPSGSAWYNANYSLAISVSWSGTHQFSKWTVTATTGTITIASPTLTSTKAIINGAGTIKATFVS